MGYQQGTGDLQRGKTTAAVTLGSSNGAASVSCEGTRISLSITLNGNLAHNTIAGPITINNPDIKATSVIESCVQGNVIFSPFDVFAVQDGSCKVEFINYAGTTIPNGSTDVFSVMIYN